MALWNLGDDAASEKLNDMGERCAELGCGFCTRPEFPIPEDRILLKVWSPLLFPGEGMPPLYDALLSVLEFKAVGRFCLRAAILDCIGDLNPSGVLL